MIDFEIWWNSADADDFRAEHEEFDGEHFRPVWDAAIRTCLAAPQPAQADARPTDDELWDQTLRERDEYHETADKLAAAIAKYFGVDIGEHSNANCPWDEALEVIENATQADARVGLTAEQRASITWAIRAAVERGYTADADVLRALLQGANHGR